MRFTLCPLASRYDQQISMREFKHTLKRCWEKGCWWNIQELFLPPVGGTVLSEPDGGFLAACVCQLEQERRSVARLRGRQAERWGEGPGNPPLHPSRRNARPGPGTGESYAGWWSRRPAELRTAQLVICPDMRAMQVYILMYRGFTGILKEGLYS